MYQPDFTKTMLEILTDLLKNNFSRYEKLKKKMDQVLIYPQHQKPLSYNLKHYRRAHVDTQFVLVFRIVEETKTVKFVDFDHHDKIYKKRFFE